MSGTELAYAAMRSACGTELAYDATVQIVAGVIEQRVLDRFFPPPSLTSTVLPLPKSIRKDLNLRSLCTGNGRYSR
eukprot:2921437-Rhodomonas_salina.1